MIIVLHRKHLYGMKKNNMLSLKNIELWNTPSFAVVPFGVVSKYLVNEIHQM